jgi:hypothetical protein
MSDWGLIEKNIDGGVKKAGERKEDGKGLERIGEGRKTGPSERRKQRMIER